MGFADILAQVVWNADTGTWEWTAGSGNVGAVASQLIYDEVQRHIEGMANTLQDLTRDLYAGEMSVAEWQAAAAQQIKSGWLSSSMYAVGGRENMTAAEFGRVGGGLKDEFRYLTNFARQIADGKRSEAQALSRVQQYADASRQAYYDEWARQRDNPDWNDLPRLKQVPGDGGTRCRGNCNCEILETADGLVWKLNEAEHCEDCEALANGGPYQYAG